MLPGDEFAPVVASRIMPNGNVVKIYDYAHGAMVMETGTAYSPPSYKPLKGEPRSLDKVWAAIAPGEAIPEALAGLQARINTERDISTWPGASEPSKAAITRQINSDGGGPILNSPVGCNNGCCDFEWMVSEFWMCDEDYDVDWMNFNDTWESRNVNDAWLYDGFVCSAAGTTRYEWSLGDESSGLVDVHEANYFYHWWIGDPSPWPWDSWYDEDLWAFTAEPFDPHLHTWCGGVERE